MFEAIKSKNKELVERFIKLNVNLEERDKEHNTALHVAVYSGLVEIVKLLLQNGADVNASGNLGITPLHYAAIFNFEDIINLLLENGADYTKTADGGVTVSEYGSLGPNKNVGIYISSIAKVIHIQLSQQALRQQINQQGQQIQQLQQRMARLELLSTANQQQPNTPTQLAEQQGHFAHPTTRNAPLPQQGGGGGGGGVDENDNALTRRLS